MTSPIVLIPGLLCSPDVFAPQLPALWRRGAVMVASTLQGETMSELAAAILAQAPPRFALAGISMGGYIAMEIMHQAPERVLRLALLDTSARADTAEQVEARKAMIEASREDFVGWSVQALSTLTHPSRYQDAGLRSVYAHMAATIGYEGFVRQQRAIMQRVDARETLATVTVPTTVMVGDADAFTPPSMAEEMAALIPDATLLTIPTCGHIATLEQPEFVNAGLAAWLDDRHA